MKIVKSLLCFLGLLSLVKNELQKIDNPEKLNRVTNRKENKWTPYYSAAYSTPNNMTGTGNYLKDIAYRESCLTLDCETNCCIGPINDLKCGNQKDCDEFAAYIRKMKIITYIVFAVIGLIIVLIICCVKSCQRKRK